MKEYLERVMHQSVDERSFDAPEKLPLGCRNAFELNIVKLGQREFLVVGTFRHAPAVAVKLCGDQLSLMTLPLYFLPTSNVEPRSIRRLASFGVMKLPSVVSISSTRS